MSEETKLKRLPEDYDEARYFRECYGGNSIYGVHQALRIWTVTHAYPNGSQAKTMAAMTNVVAEHIEELNALRDMNSRMLAALRDCSTDEGPEQEGLNRARSLIAEADAVQPPKGEERTQP